jgi:hypothetical protein
LHDYKLHGYRVIQRMNDELNITGVKYMVLFFAGGETRDDKFNVFTGSFINLMKQILNEEFDFIKGIYFRMPFMNVIWALNNSQEPIREPDKRRITKIGLQQLLSKTEDPDTQLIIVSSSSGSVVAAQTACYLAESNREGQYLKKPFHVALGSTLVSRESALYKQLADYQSKGIIGKFIYDELQDPGDTTTGVGDQTRKQAWRNAFGLIFPKLSAKYSGPSFLNTDPVNGHLHRRRSQTVQKAIDFIEVLLLKNMLAGEQNKIKALEVLKEVRAQNK